MHTLRIDSIDSASAGASVSASAVQQWSRELRQCLSIYLYIYIYLSICIYAHVYVYAHYILNGKEVQ